jgi:hypothetical protein
MDIIQKNIKIYKHNGDTFIGSEGNNGFIISADNKSRIGYIIVCYPRFISKESISIKVDNKRIFFTKDNFLMLKSENDVIYPEIINLESKTVFRASLKDRKRMMDNLIKPTTILLKND